jgi:hypothetical protein
VTKDTAVYLSYLIRLWRTDALNTWKASLEDPVSGRRVGFGDLPSLFAFLRRQTQQGGFDGTPDCNRGKQCTHNALGSE